MKKEELILKISRDIDEANAKNVTASENDYVNKGFYLGQINAYLHVLLYLTEMEK